MPSATLTPVITYTYLDSHFNGFQLVAAPDAQPLLLGAFLANFGQGGMWRFDGCPVPFGSTVTSAILRLVPAASYSGTLLDLPMRPVPRSGGVSGTSAYAMASSLWWRDVADGWKPDADGASKFRLRLASVDQLIVDAGASNAIRTLRRTIDTGGAIDFQRSSVSQAVAPLAADVDFDEAALRINRLVGAGPGGDAYVDLYQAESVSMGGGLYTTIPTSLIASSDPVAISSMGTTQHAALVSFPFSSQQTVEAGSLYHLVLRVPDVTISSDTVEWTQNRPFVGWANADPTQAANSAQLGDAIAFSRGNFSGERDGRRLMVDLGDEDAALPADINWQIGDVTAAVSIDSPNLAALLQYQIDSPTYSEGGPVGVGSALPGGVNNATRTFASVGSIVPPLLLLTWTNPVAVGAPDEVELGTDAAEVELRADGAEVELLGDDATLELLGDDAEVELRADGAEVELLPDTAEIELPDD